MIVEYQKLEGNLKVGIVLALEEKLNKGRDYKGLTFPQIKEKVKKYDTSISDEDFKDAMKSAMSWGFIRVSEIGGKDCESKESYRFNNLNNFDCILECVGFIKKSEEILVK